MMPLLLKFQKGQELVVFRGTMRVVFFVSSLVPRASRSLINEVRAFVIGCLFLHFKSIFKKIKFFLFFCNFKLIYF